MKKFLATLLAAIMLMSCSALAEIVPGQLPLSDETVTLTIGIGTNTMVEDWNTNAQTLIMEKNLNINLEFIELGSGDDLNTKLDLMMMDDSQKLPDILMVGLSLDAAMKYGQMGRIIPLTEYFENGKAYFTEQTLAEGGYTMDQRLPYVTCYDGEVYGMFAFADTVHNSYSKSFAFVFEPWLEALDMDKPQTTEEFVEMLRAFKEKDPNGNGIADEIPMMSCNNYVKTNLMYFLMNPFIPTKLNYLDVNEEGTITFAANDTRWKDGMKWVKSLIDEGLLSPLSLTQDQAQLTAIMNPDPEVVGVIARISSTNLGASDIRRSQYICLDPLEGPDGERNSTRDAILPTLRASITADCENPDVAFAFLDYMNEEMMGVWNRYGEKDVDWKEPEAGAVGAFESLGFPAQITVISTWGVLQNQWWAQTGPGILLAKWGSGQAIENIDYNAAAAIGRSMAKCVEYANDSLVGFVYSEDEQEIINEFQSTINTYVVNSWSEFVTGVKDIDAEWDKYVGEFEKMGLSTYLEAVQSCYDRMFK
ncbi:MAG: extracellular solute-binding protein [Clostridiales bacterium]|nr:extracellular solute-binding protein [Clostridiales bacterium]